MRMRSFHAFIAIFALACGSPSVERASTGPADTVAKTAPAPKPPQAAAPAPKCPDGTARVLVTPFINGAQADTLSALSFSLASHVSESLESDPCVRAVTGDEFVLTEEIARLVTPQGKEPEAGLYAAANKLARRTSATHYLIGGFSGKVERWEMRATLCPTHETDDGAGDKCVTGYASGSLIEDVKLPNGKTGVLQSAARLHEQLGSTIARTFEITEKFRAPRPAETTIKAIATSPSQSKEFYAELILGRAYLRLFHFERPQQRAFAALKTWKAKAKFIRMLRKADRKYTAQGLAAAAVRVDPKYVAAQRTFAALAVKSVTLKNPVSKARIHYEMAVAAGPKDFRSLMALGSLEMANDDATTARGYFVRAAQVRPDDARGPYLAAQASLALDDAASAIAWFERTRTVQPAHADARKALAKLYADGGRYGDAATEYAAIVQANPGDLESRFAYGALMHADGRASDAIEAFSDLCHVVEAGTISDSMRASACKFAGDALAESGKNEAARKDALSYYHESARLNPKDRRANAILAGSTEVPLGGRALKEAIAEAVSVVADIELHRSRYQTALNDAVMDLRLNGGAGCMDGGGASSALLAMSEGKMHTALRTRLGRLMRQVNDAYLVGEGRAMTPDLRPRVTASNDALQSAARDSREMRTSYDRAFMAYYRRYRCGSYDGEIAPATFDMVYARNGARYVEVPEKRRDAGAPMYFSPMIAADIARNVSISVDNREGGEVYAVQFAATDRKEIAWQTAGEVPAGEVAEIPARIGLYRVCVVPKGAACDASEAERIAYLHEGWHMRIRSKR